ncbi:DNA-(apurinic or apyrimidinic site) endonuclease, chloroplastic-like isoform X2 [Benincasa hispida]|uniref:DNA-(apurinic or apyrimidinic site) endonuclease, chloroplastic-like isoform X2 n=1 Tax=Benincasa hispida TaxID=102211 RepID=UPI00190253B6|nr:DNA-(apurinic or apyrimidinic site) endonuclease, chloroplastic-like isoform X2 [Benincasa hispida]
MKSALQLGFRSFLHPSSLVVNQSRLRVATLIPNVQRNVIASDQSSITLSTQNSEPGGTRRDISLENDCKADIQSFKDDLSRIEAMTVQELRMTLRSVGLLAKGRKRELVTALQCFVENKTVG